MTENSFPSSMQTSPGAPLTRTGRLSIPSREKEIKQAGCVQRGAAYDQAHLIADFRDLLGVTPNEMYWEWALTGTRCSFNRLPASCGGDARPASACRRPAAALPRHGHQSRPAAPRSAMVKLPRPP